MHRHFGKDKIIFLLGAGASCDAGMKNSFQMINEIENELKGAWREYRDLYNYVHSSHNHLERIRGTEPREIIFNIENLVALLDGIIKISEKKVDIYPFIGSWEKELYLVAGSNFDKAIKFKKAILERLKNIWLSPEDWKGRSSYYKKLKEIGYNYPLKIFSLNYDMCIEQNLSSNEGANLERGFNEERLWDYRRYEPMEEQEVNYFLYKLHGSLDWKRDEQKRLKFTDEISNIDPLNMEIIFGVQNKLQSYDPYLFYFYAFKEACIEAELIVTSGYGFLDGHINDNLISSFRLDPAKKLLVNVYEGQDFDDTIFKKKIAEKIEIQEQNITVVNTNAKNFFNEKVNLEYFSSLFPEEGSQEPF